MVRPVSPVKTPEARHRQADSEIARLMATWPSGKPQVGATAQYMDPRATSARVGTGALAAIKARIEAMRRLPHHPGRYRHPAAT
jgi:hypothetical protein